MVADLKQLYTFGDPGRDPRDWTVSVAYLALVEQSKVRPRASDDAAEVSWFALDDLPELAFDHALILERARRRLKG
jgi:8-oxo-dGTP diphosphatase